MTTGRATISWPACVHNVSLTAVFATAHLQSCSTSTITDSQLQRTAEVAEADPFEDTLLQRRDFKHDAEGWQHRSLLLALGQVVACMSNLTNADRTVGQKLAPKLSMWQYVTHRPLPYRPVSDNGVVLSEDDGDPHGSNRF